MFRHLRCQASIDWDAFGGCALWGHFSPIGHPEGSSEAHSYQLKIQEFHFLWENDGKWTCHWTHVLLFFFPFCGPPPKSPVTKCPSSSYKAPKSLPWRSKRPKASHLVIQIWNHLDQQNGFKKWFLNVRCCAPSGTAMVTGGKELRGVEDNINEHLSIIMYLRMVIQFVLPCYIKVHLIYIYIYIYMVRDFKLSDKYRSNVLHPKWSLADEKSQITNQIHYV